MATRQTIDIERDTLSLLSQLETTRITFSGNVRSQIVAGEDIELGDVLVPSPTVDNVIIKSTTSADEKVLGVCAKNATAGPALMVTGGEFIVKTIGTVIRGEFLATSSTDGVAESTGTSGSEGDFAIATTGTTTSPGTVYARFKKSDVY